MEKYRKIQDDGRRLFVSQLGDTDFEVQNQLTGRTRLVDLSEKSCSCGIFTEMQFPCKHAAAAIIEANTSNKTLNTFVHPSYLTCSLKSIYSERSVSVDLAVLECGAAPKPPRFE